MLNEIRLDRLHEFIEADGHLFPIPMLLVQLGTVGLNHVHAKRPRPSPVLRPLQ
jgi:hypothetical protein